MEAAEGLEHESGAEDVRHPRVSDDCGCQGARTNGKGRGQVAMPEAQHEQIELSQRDLALYQAGQAAGAAHAYREFARQLKQQVKALEAEAAKTQAQCNRLLDSALGAAIRGAKLGRRVVKAARALMGSG